MSRKGNLPKAPSTLAAQPSPKADATDRAMHHAGQVLAHDTALDALSRRLQTRLAANGISVEQALRGLDAAREELFDELYGPRH